MSTSDSITSLLRDGDLARLTARLDARTASLDELAALIRHGRASRHLALLHIERWLDQPVSAAARGDIARLLPVRLDDGPEVALLLARLHRRLAPWLAGTLPDWRTAGLPVAIEVEWLRTELIASPAVVAREPFSERLLQSLAPDTLVISVDPAAGLTALAQRGEQPLQQAAIAQLRSALRRSRLRPHDARALLEDLAGSPHDAVAAAALRELAEPWSLALPSPGAALSSQLARPAVLAAALECAARWRLEGPLRAAMENPAVEPRLRQRAMELAGSFASRRDVPAAIAIAASDPLLFGPPLVVFLRAQHRLGHFVADEDAARLARICLANADVPAGEIADLMFTARGAFAAALLDDTALDDPSWARRAELLVALARGPQGKSPLAIGAALEAVLRATVHPRVRRALIQALGEIEYFDGEQAVLAHLEAEPGAALAALRSIGGRAAVFAVIAAVDHVALRPFRDAALTLAWHLSETEAEARAAVRSALQAGAVPPAIELQLEARSTADELARLQGVPRDATASYFLRRVAAVAGATEWPLIGDLVLRVVSDVAAGTILHPTHADDSRPWVFNPAAAGKPVQTLPDADREALEAMGRRLYRAGCLRPRALLDARSERDAGPLLVSALGRTLLERTDLRDAETAILLGLLDPGIDRRVFPAIHRMLRRPEPEIRKRVVALLARDGADELLANLTALTEADDIETVRQAILAIGALGPRGGASVGALTRCLEHRNMNIKKAAAEALATAGGPAAVGRLVFWLGYHDNPGLRSALVAALRAILGDAYAATVVATLVSLDAHRPDEPRRQTLLLDALGGALACDDAVALCRSDLPFAAQLRDAILAGDVPLASGDRTSFAIALDGAPPGPHRAAHERVAPAQVASGGTAAERAAQAQVDLARSLSDHGFDVARARSLLSAARASSSRWDPRALAWLRRFWREWCAWLDADRDDLRAARADAGDADDLGGAADGAGDDRASLVRLLARLAEVTTPAGDELAALARHCAALATIAAETHDDEAHDAAIALLLLAAPALPAPARLVLAEQLRASPGRPNLSARDPFALLRACGAVLLRGDVDRVLRDARHTADPAAIERRVLRAAFSAGAGASGLAAADRLELEDAARRGEGNELAALRARLRAPAERLVDALIEVYPVAHEVHRRALVDWLEALQPLGAPRWTMTEQARELDERSARTRQPRASDLDQPRSQALAERLEAMLGAPNAEQRRTAAQALLAWSEPRAQALAVEAYLRGAADLEPSAALAAAAELTESRPRLVESLADRDARPRLLQLLPRAPALAQVLTPALLGIHDDAVDADDAETGRLAIQALQAVPVDRLLAALVPRFAESDFGLADALPRAMRSSPELDAAIDHAHRHGRDALVTRWREHEIRPPSARDDQAQRQAFAHALSELRMRAPAPAAAPPAASRAVSRAELLRSVASGTVDEARRALTALARAPDAAIVALLHEQLGHAQPRMRLHAHRLLRSCETRDAYLEATTRLLDDPIDDVRRMAIRALGFARFAPAVPGLVELLADRSAVVRRAAEEALVYLGEASRGHLRHTLAGARPDRRAVYQRVLDQLDRAEPRSDTDS